MKMRRLLHPTDFSSASGPAFKLALELARNRASLLLLHVLPPVPLVPDVYVAASVYERLRQAYEESARKRLDRLRRKAVAARVRASALLRDSASAPEEIVRRSEERRVGKECRSRWLPYYLKKKKRRTLVHIQDL